MRRKIAVAVFLALIVVPSFVSAAPQDDLTIWKEFVQLLKTDALTADRVRPASPLTPESQLALLRDFAKNATWEEWEAAPEVVRYGNLVSFIITLGQKRNSPWSYTFNFVVEDGRWYYRFLEGIFIRLDKVGKLPADASGFPDVPEERKDWMRQEIYWSEQVRLFNFLAQEKGKDIAFRWVAEGIGNGVGYLLGAATWVPFYPPSRAFILYLCWEQAKLQGNKVTLEKLGENEAVVRFDDIQYFALYMRTSHLKKQISLDDYIKIFETIWQERARAAGWNLKIDGQGRQIYLRFSR
ncbi:MAG: hypothetical protein MUQ00_17475 [Candidatus Aminicenantes bacterium]|nr:hypothetical protein [Candidatus Aminicenantes bacterium]